MAGPPRKRSGWPPRSVITAGKPLPAVLLSAPRFRISTQMLEPLARTVADAGREVAVRLGYRSDSATS